MAGKNEIVEQALKLVAGGLKEEGPTAAQRALENQKVIDTAKRLGVDASNVGQLNETKKLMDYHQGFMGNVNDRAKQLAEVTQYLKDQGAFPMEVGTRFTTPMSREQGHPPHLITGYYVNPKNPTEAYGYRTRQEWPNGDFREGNMMLRDPKLEAIHGPEKWKQLLEGYTPMTGPRVAKAGGGRALAEALRIAQEGIEGLSKGSGKSAKELLSGFANHKPRVPFEEWRYEYEPTAKLLPSQEFNPESFKPGDVIIPLVGDRTSTGRKITSVAGEKLETPSTTEGGPDYMRGPSQQEDQSVWASGKGVITGLEGRIDNALKASEAKGYKDPNVYGAYVAMGPQSGDFSTHTAETVMGMLPNAKIKRADVKEFDNAMREKFPDWPGLMSPSAADYVVNAGAGEHRKTFLDVMDTAYWRNKNFPDVSLARYVTTTPELVTAPTEAAGYNIARITPGVKPEIITQPHRSYPSTMHGEYVGGLPEGLNRDELFTQFSRGFDADPPARNYVMAKRRSFGMDPHAYQVMDEPEIEALIRKVQSLKQGYADGGEVDDAIRIAKDVGGSTDQVFMTDANGVQYDANGKVVQPATVPAKSNSAATPAAPTPQEVGRRAAEDPATFDALMMKYAVPDRDVAEYEALQTAVRQQPQDVQQMTHVGAPPMRDVSVDAPLLGGEYKLGQAPYNVAGPMSGAAQAAYDFKTAPLYMTPFTAPLGAGIDVAEGVATGDPLQTSMAALGAPGKFAKAAVIGGANLMMDPAQAQAGPERWFSKALEIAKEIPMPKMTGEQALAMLRKGTSPEELRWMGADDFLSGKKSVTKDELVDYLNKNRVQVNEVRLGEPNKRIATLNDVDQDIIDRYEPKIKAAENEYKTTLDYFHSVFGTDAEESAWKAVTDKKREFNNLQQSAIQEMRDRVGPYRPAKYEQYSTPGGIGYGESLYTLGALQKPRVEKVNGVWALVDQNGNVMRSQSGSELTYWNEGDARRAAGSIHRGSGRYQSSHWDDPDVIAHSRSQTLMYEPEGSNRAYKVHNVDETQSDWGQDARKRGISDPQEIKRWEEELKQIRRDMVTTRDQIEQISKDKFAAAGGMEEMPWRERVKIMEVVQPQMDADPQVIGLRNKIENLRLKLMQHDRALDSDADYFSWTPGQAHADRYDLSRHIGSVNYDPYYGQFQAFDPSGRTIVSQDMRDSTQIDDYVGKELGDKIRDMVAKRKAEFYNGVTLESTPDEKSWSIVKDGKPLILYSQQATGFPSKSYAAEFLDDAFGDYVKENPIELSGLDLKTGGEGMIGYYDKVYLKRVQDVIKKATGEKPQIEVITVETADGPRQQLGIRLTDEMREKARFSDFASGGTVTGSHSYGNNDAHVNHALALTREY